LGDGGTGACWVDLNTRRRTPTPRINLEHDHLSRRARAGQGWDLSPRRWRSSIPAGTSSPWRARTSHRFRPYIAIWKGERTAPRPGHAHGGRGRAGADGREGRLAERSGLSADGDTAERKPCLPGRPAPCSSKGSSSRTATPSSCATLTEPR
jgi:hypothetical protein